MGRISMIKNENGTPASLNQDKKLWISLYSDNIVLTGSRIEYNEAFNF